MQLKDEATKAALLGTAATTLLATVASPASAAGNEEWQVDATVLYYGEIGRVTAAEPVLSLKRQWSAEEVLAVNMAYDALSGASHNGAAVVDEVQTFTSASGSRELDFAAGEVPLIKGFEDERFAADFSYTQPIATLLKTITTGATFSTEKDYLSLGFNGAYAQEFNRRNTKVSVGGSASFDRIEPENGLPAGLEDVESVDALQADSRDHKQVVDVILGLTQVINKQAIVQLNYNTGWSKGYHNDPYKIVSVLDADGLPTNYLNEARPNSRNKQSVYGALKWAIGADSLTTSYRFYWDDWGVQAHTIDSRYRWAGFWNNSDRWFTEGHGRFYRQSAANFYSLSLDESVLTSLPEFASADYRLGDLTTTTLGINVGFKITDAQSVALRAEWYQQHDPVTGNKAANIDAIITQFTYSLGF